MNRPRLHVVGAGLAGLAAAVEATSRGCPVTLYDATPHAGGRCRSFYDPRLGRVIDNGTHLLLSGNRAVLSYARQVGGATALTARPAAYPFLDLGTGMRWTLRPNAGPLPWWVSAAGRRVPGSRPRDYLALAALRWASPSATVADQLADHPLYDRLIVPLTVAILNTEPERASARLLGAVLAETLARGAGTCRPLTAPKGLSAALIDPALAWLTTHGATLALGRRLDSFDSADGRIMALRISGEIVPLNAGDSVILAIPPVRARRVLPDMIPRLDTRPIVNAHFRLPRPIDPTQAPPLLGLIGGTAQWLFVRDDIVSVTVSAAMALVDQPPQVLAARLWQDVEAVLGRSALALPDWRVIKERKATLAHSPSLEALRPGARTHLTNLWLAGDWTETALPSTLEGAVRSGRRAARLAVRFQHGV